MGYNMIDTHNQPSQVVRRWVASEIRESIDYNNCIREKEDKEPIRYTPDDIECLVDDVLNGIHERCITPAIKGRFNIEEAY